MLPIDKFIRIENSSALVKKCLVYAHDNCDIKVGDCLGKCCRQTDIQTGNLLTLFLSGGYQIRGRVCSDFVEWLE